MFCSSRIRTERGAQTQAKRGESKRCCSSSRWKTPSSNTRGGWWELVHLGAAPNRRKPPGLAAMILGEGMLQARCRFGGSLRSPGTLPTCTPGSHHLLTPQGSRQAAALQGAGSRSSPTAPSSPTSAAAWGRSLGEMLLPREAKGEGASNSSGSFLWLVVYIAPAPSRLLP